jgi:hypothetical protein
MSMTLEELRDLVVLRRKMGSSEGAVWPSGALSTIHTAIAERDELRAVKDRVLKLVDDWRDGCEGLSPDDKEAVLAACKEIQDAVYDTEPKFGGRA